MSYVIFNADDYGLSPAVSAGILAASAGVVRSTTIMANLVIDEELHALAHSVIKPGIHLNLSCGLPLTTAYPAQLRRVDGTFNKQLAHDPATWENPANLQAARREWQAQLARLLEAGVALDHVDSHHHLHLHPALFPLALEIAQAQRWGLRTAEAWQREAAKTVGVPTPDVLCTGYFGDNYISREVLLAELKRAQGGVVELMCHPGRVDELLRQRSGYTAEREAELAVLGDPGLAEALECNGWQIADYGVCATR